MIVSKNEIGLALLRSTMRGRIEPMFGVEEIADLNEDLVRFLFQEQLLARLDKKWPSVVTSTDDNINEGFPEGRAVPIDLASFCDSEISVSDFGETMERIFTYAQDEGIAIWTVPLPSARKYFFEGLRDVIYSRSGWFTSGAPSSQTNVPNVTVTSAPANQQALWTKGHFFGRHTVFGTTTHDQTVSPGIYSFWLRHDVPTPHLPLYDIQKDTTVPL